MVLSILIFVILLADLSIDIYLLLSRKKVEIDHVVESGCLLAERIARLNGKGLTSTDKMKIATDFIVEHLNRHGIKTSASEAAKLVEIHLERGE